MITYNTWARNLGWKHRVKQKARYWSSKWPLAGFFNRFQRTCWSDLVDWALHKKTGDPDEDEGYQLRYSLSGGERCRTKSADPDIRQCYCAKFTDGCLTPKDWTPEDAA